MLDLIFLRGGGGASNSYSFLILLKLLISIFLLDLNLFCIYIALSAISSSLLLSSSYSELRSEKEESSSDEIIYSYYFSPSYFSETGLLSFLSTLSSFSDRMFVSKTKLLASHLKSLYFPCWRISLRSIRSGSISSGI